MTTFICFLGTSCIVMSLYASNLQSHYVVLPVTEELNIQWFSVYLYYLKNTQNKEWAQVITDTCNTFTTASNSTIWKRAIVVTMTFYSTPLYYQYRRKMFWRISRNSEILLSSLYNNACNIQITQNSVM